MYYVDRYSKKLIKAINRSKPDAMGYSDVDDVVKCMETDRNSAILAIKHLEDLGLLYTAKMGGTIVGVQKTHVCRYRFQFNWIEFKRFLFTSILTPILVSAATTLLTLAISTLLQPM